MTWYRQSYFIPDALHWVPVQGIWDGVTMSRPGVFWLWHVLFSIAPNSVFCFYTRVIAVSQAFMALFTISHWSHQWFQGDIEWQVEYSFITLGHSGGASVLCILYNGRMKRKKEESWLSPMTKAPPPTQNSKKQSDNTKTPPKFSMAQRLLTDLGWSVGVTTATRLVGLNRFAWYQPSH